MSRTEAINRAKVWRGHLLNHGVSKVSIEVVQGRGPSSHPWWTNTFVGSMGHHIVSHRGQGTTPFLNLVKVGRADLPGPICNAYGGFDEVARIICMGWANHPGAGGPISTESGVVPQNNGRPYFLGWEFEGGISLSDWTPSFREFMGRCHAGTLSYVGELRRREVTQRSHVEHKTWAPTRKVDRKGYTLDTARAEAARYLEEYMAITRQSKADDGLPIFTDAMKRAIAAGVASEHTQPGGVAFNDEVITMLDRLGIWGVWDRIRAVEAENAQLAKEIAVLKQQPPPQTGGLAYGSQVTLGKP